MDLPPHISSQIDRLCEQGHALEDAGHFEQAIAVFASAHALLPEPSDAWEASCWLNTSIGDCYFLLGQWQAAYNSFRLAIIEGEQGRRQRFWRKPRRGRTHRSSHCRKRPG
jgi:tetratricopeptide (TPR) repeat protein